MKAPASVFQSMDLFSKWKGHCKQQYWFYRTWFLNWCFAEQSQINQFQPTVGCDNDVTMAPCVDGEAGSNHTGSHVQINSAGDTKSSKSTNSKTHSTSTYDEDDDDKNPNNFTTIKLKKEHELDLDEIAQVASCVEKTDQEIIVDSGDESTSPDQEEDAKTEDIDFSTVCSAMGYRYST